MRARVAFVIAVLAAAAGLWLWQRLATEGISEGVPAPATPPGAIAPATDAARLPAEAAPGETSRERAIAPPRTDVPVPAPPPQGWRGVTLDERNQPLGGVEVHLLESAANDPLSVPLIVEQRLPLGPLATTKTAADGTFAIGLPVVQDRLYELFFVTETRAPVRIAGLRMLAAQWYDLGVVTIGPGTTLRGRVTMAGADTPVPGAVVTVETGVSFIDAALRAMPYGERSLSANVDATGRYELRAPRLGVVRVSAIAPGFARIAQAGISLGNAPFVEVDFVLPPGLSIRGRIRDEFDRGIPEARVEAWPGQSSGTPLVATSDREGWFSVANLTAGGYRLRVTARGFQAAEQRDVAAGRADLLLTLSRRSSLSLRVLTPAGAIVRDFQFGVRRCLTDRGGRLTFVPEVPDQRAHLPPDRDAVDIAAVPAGTVVCQVTAEGYATTFSAPVEVEPARDGVAPPPHSVDVIVSTGVLLRGQILDEQGRPLRGATVATRADGATPDSPVWRMLAAATPDRITSCTATTDANGQFELPLLALGDYQLEVQHPEACWTRQNGIRLDAQGQRTLAPIRLLRGALVAGRATIAGRTAGQMKIVLTTPSNRASRDDDGLRVETVADADGFFQLPRRIPPGMYELRAAVVDTTDPQTQHFQHLLQLQRSATSLSVPVGQDRVERDIDIPNDH